ncbi:MAG: hypothetical protein H0X30_33530 [Anaerolineae bacterium]|nr:hypothetical protein [Anaerolineae bacterium]
MRSALIRSNRIAFIFLLALFCVGCSQSETVASITTTAESLLNAPLPLPEFIGHIRPPPNSTITASDKICISVYQGALWEAGTDAATLKSYIVANTHFAINNQQINPESASTTQDFGLTKEGKITDKYGSNIEFCLAPRLTSTAHVITVTTSSVSNKNFTYSWMVMVK